MSPDIGFLRDMLHEARRAQDFVRGMSEEDFLASLVTQYAVIRALEIIGEAANRVTAESRAQLPALPWREIIGQRHVAIHHYQKVTMPRVWATVRDDLPPLIETLERFLRGVE